MKNQPTTVTMDDIIFEGRNKLYGAYQLRQSSSRNHLSATALTVLLFLSCMLITKFSLTKENIEEKGKTVVFLEEKVVHLPVENEIPVVKEQEIAKSEPEQNIAQIEHPEYVVKRDDEVGRTDHTHVEDILASNAAISHVTVEGNNTPRVVDEVASVHVSGPNSAGAAAHIEASNSSEVHTIVEIHPEFPGGQAAMIKFIMNNIRYPEVALDNGIEGTAVVQFIIEKDGTVSNVQVVRDPGGGLGREAERVIKSMPKWKPGKQRDNAVRVKMSAPVKFRATK